MNNTWILVAHRGGARVFDNTGPGQGLNLLQDIPHPQGKLKSKDIGSDKPGRGSGSRGARTSFQQEQEPAAHVAEVFAKQLAGLLDDGRLKQRYGRLVLVAEPHFLGILRAALSRETAALVTAAVNKDLGHVEAHELPKHLEGVVRI
jgi:protein required for attachment to host cells